MHKSVVLITELYFFIDCLITIFESQIVFFCTLRSCVFYWSFSRK